MTNSSWVERIINLRANTPFELDFRNPINTLIIRNPDTANIIRMDLQAGISSTKYEAIANFDGFGVIVRSYTFNKAYLFATANIVNVRIYEVYSENPVVLLQNMIQSQAVAQNVNVTGTVGLKVSELNIDAARNLHTVVTNPGLRASELNIDTARNLHTVVVSQPEVNPIGWTWQRLSPTVAGDVIVKSSAGKVALLTNDSAAVITLRDGDVQAWRSGDFNGFGCPLICRTAIRVHFSAAGTAWILFQ